MSLGVRDKRIVVLVVGRISGLRGKYQQRAAVLIRQDFNAGACDWRGTANARGKDLAKRICNGRGGTADNRRHIVSSEVGDIHQTGAGRNGADETAPERKSKRFARIDLGEAKANDAAFE